MKIGILTFHCAANFGAVLQAHALQEVLRRMGHEAYVVDYRPKYLTMPYKAFKYELKGRSVAGYPEELHPSLSRCTDSVEKEQAVL